MVLELRAMLPRDRAPLARLGIGLFAEFGDYSQALPIWLRSPGHWCRVLADGSEAPVGLALVTVTEGPKRSRQGYILALGVQDSLRGKGWGRKLLKDSIAELHRRKRQLDLHWIHLNVAASNRPAIHLFESAGFRPSPGEIARYGDGEIAINMRRALD